MKNRSERNKDFETPAMSIFKDKQLITKRPENMPFEDYKLLRQGQNLILGELFRKGHSPNRKLMGVMSSHKPIFQTGAGFRKRSYQRKAS